jgi:hypothetical protein
VLIAAAFPQPVPMDSGDFLTGLLIKFALTVTIGTVIGAIVLRAACWLYNKIAGDATDSASVREPSFGGAMAITFVTMLANFTTDLLLLFYGKAAEMSYLKVSLISASISFVVASVMIAALLPTTFGRAMAVVILQLLIGIAASVVVAVIAGAALLVFFAAGWGK